MIFDKALGTLAAVLFATTTAAAQTSYPIIVSSERQFEQIGISLRSPGIRGPDVSPEAVKAAIEGQRLPQQINPYRLMGIWNAGSKGGSDQQRGQFGTAAEAEAMLLKVVVALKADKDKALDMINMGEGGFLDRDLYPFCFNAGDGKAIAAASPNAKQALGRDVRTLRDVTGKLYGQELFSAAQKPEGQITEVSYMFPTPSDPKPLAKVSFVTTAAVVGCGVGYYRPLAPGAIPKGPRFVELHLLKAPEHDDYTLYS